MTVEFTGEVWFWKGPSPFYFVTVPEPQASELREVVRQVTYGWGMVPVNATIGETTWYTALWPKDGAYILPLKDKVRRIERIGEGQIVGASLEVVKS